MSSIVINDLSPVKSQDFVTLDEQDLKVIKGGKPGDVTVILVDEGCDGTIDMIIVIVEL